MAGCEPEIGQASWTDDRRAVGCHRPQASPELGLAHVATVRKQIVHDELERAPAPVVELEIEPRQLRGTAYADAIAEPRYGDLVRLVHDRRLGCLHCIADRHCDRE